MQTIEQRVANRIYGNGRGSAFSPKDFIDEVEFTAVWRREADERAD